MSAADVVAVQPVGDDRLRVVFSCGALATITREEAGRLATDQAEAAAFLRRHTSWATNRKGSR